MSTTSSQQTGSFTSPRKNNQHGMAHEVRISKTLSYILRHGAKKESLKLRPDGYVKVSDILARPKLKGVDFAQIQWIVETNEKKRFHLVHEPVDGESSDPLIVTGWWIRANQGHTIKVEDLELEEIKTPEEAPVAIHGTSHEAWKLISVEGLSRMRRNHIHLAAGLPGADGVISGMRKGSEVLIHIDVENATSQGGLKFFRSVNGVILTPGDENGFIHPLYFKKVEITEPLEQVETTKEPE